MGLLSRAQRIKPRKITIELDQGLVDAITLYSSRARITPEELLRECLNLYEVKQISKRRPQHKLDPEGEAPHQ